MECLSEVAGRLAGRRHHPGKQEEKTVPLVDEPLRIRRFKLVEGGDLTIYCRLLRLRSGPAGTFSLYEDHHGREWMEIFLNGQSCLVPLGDKSFEKAVADELQTLGFNKYSG
jgi:hypothetical protein